MIQLYEGYKVKNDPPVLALHSCDTKQLNANLVIQFLYITWPVDFCVLVLVYVQVFDRSSLSTLCSLLILCPASLAYFSFK